VDVLKEKEKPRPTESTTIARRRKISTKWNPSKKIPTPT
jgi:hypothetical protein